MLEFKIAGTEIKWLAWGITVFAGFTMVSNLPYYSGKEINLRKSVPFITVLLLVLFFFVLIPSQPPVVLFCVFMLYALSGYIMWILQWRKKKKSTAIQES